MPDSFDYTTGTNSENVRLLQALIDESPEYTEETNSRNANILKSIINNTEYTDAPQSEIEELLLRLKAKIGGEIEVDELNVTENGTYDAGVNKAYNPVKVELPLSSKTITENGTYTASDDNLAGFNEVTVAVEGYAKKSIANTPTAIATFNASALPMPSLSVGIEPVQDLHGYDSPWVGGAGKNKLNLSTRASQTVNGITSEVKADNTVVASGTSTGNGDITCPVGTPFTMVNGETYTISLSGTDTRINQFTIFIGTSYRNVGYISANEHSLTFTVTSELVCNQVMLKASNGATININVKLQIEKGSTATTYVPYENKCPISGHTEANIVVSPSTDAEDGTTYTIDLDGTRYGCTLDVVSGVLTVDRAMVTLDGSNDENWLKYDYGYYIWNADMPSGTDLDGLCNLLLQKSSIGALGFKLGSNNKYMYFNQIQNNWNLPTIEDLRTFLASNNLQVVYPLATPITIQLTPTMVKSLLGTNNLWADTGDVLEGSYFKSLN